MPEDLMRYDQLAQNALKGVVREALRKVVKSGLPGEHHFYIQFDTRHPGVNIGHRLLERYPREMTVVLQHQFYNLDVNEERFQVELSFDNIPEKLVIPFSAIKGFLDPAVQFGLQFEVAPTEVVEVEKPSQMPKRETEETTETVPPDEGPKVVSLDAFRKK